MTAEQANRAKRDRRHASDNGDAQEAASQNTAQSGRIEQMDARFNDADDESQSSKRIGFALGAFSIGLGITEFMMPRTVARMMGIKPNAYTSTTMRLFGLREIAAGVGMVLQPERPLWAWMRVAGDALDFAALTRASRNSRNRQVQVGAAAVAALGFIALDTARARQLQPRRLPRTDQPARRLTERSSASVEVRRSITVNRPVEEVYAFWRDFENLPQFMQHLQSVTVTGDDTSEWKAKGPAGTTISWTAVVVEDRPDDFIAWQSLKGSQVPNSGSVQFVKAPGDRGTEVHIVLQYTPPSGKLGKFVAMMFGEEPSQQVSEDLRRFKQVLETGEVLMSDASLHRGMHPAQPSDKRPDNAPYEAEQAIVVARAADALEQSSNRDRELAPSQLTNDDFYTNELANERSNSQ